MKEFYHKKRKNKNKFHGKNKEQKKRIFQKSFRNLSDEEKEKRV